MQANRLISKDLTFLAILKLLKEIGESGGIVSCDAVFGEFIEQWLDMKKSKNRASTYASYETTVKTHILPDKISEIPLKRISPFVLQSYISRLSDAGKSAKTIQYVSIIIKQSLKSAVIWEMIPRNPADNIDLPTHIKKHKTLWNNDETARFLEAIQGDPLELFYLIAITTGMRRGEILGLTWNKVNYKNGEITVSASLSADRTLSEYVKTESSFRKTLVPKEVLDKLKCHYKDQLEKLMILGMRNEHNAIFLTSKGTLYRPDNIRRHLIGICRKIEIPEISIHSLRHLHVSWLLSQGVDFKTIQDRVGHANIRTTMDIYAHIADEMRMKAVTATEDKLSKITKRG